MIPQGWGPSHSLALRSTPPHLFLLSLRLDHASSTAPNSASAVRVLVPLG